MVILVFGDNQYAKNEYIKASKAAFTKKYDASNMNLESFDQDSLDIGKIRQSALAQPFLGSRRMVIVENLISKGGAGMFDDLADIWDRLLDESDSSNIIIFVEDKAPRKNHRIFKLSKDKLVTKEFSKLEGFAVNKWVKNYIRTQEGRIEEDAIKLLVSLVGNVQWQLQNELDKLLAYADGSKITMQAVGLLVKGNVDATIFDFIDAISARDITQASKLLHEQLESGAAPMYILSMLMRQFRILVQVKDMVEQGGTKKDISLKIKQHPYVVQKAINYSRNYALEDIVTMYERLVRIDTQLKQSQADPVLELDLLINAL
jgi:DNA polymerase-3 subunit delta